MITYIYCPPLPFCCICKKEVESLTSRSDFIHDRWEFIAECHGATETTYVRMGVIRSVNELQQGVAFKPVKSIGVL